MNKSQQFAHTLAIRMAIKKYKTQQSITLSPFQKLIIDILWDITIILSEHIKNDH